MLHFQEKKEICQNFRKKKLQLAKGDGIMETVVLLLAFIMSGIIGFIAVRKLDVFLEENLEQQKDSLENGEDVIGDGRET